MLGLPPLAQSGSPPTASPADFESRACQIVDRGRRSGVSGCRVDSLSQARGWLPRAPQGGVRMGARQTRESGQPRRLLAKLRPAPTRSTLARRSAPWTLPGALPLLLALAVALACAAPAAASDVYVPNFDSDDVSQYDVGAGGALAPKAAPTAPTGSNPVGVAVSPDGKSVYVTNFGPDTVSQYD